MWVLVERCLAFCTIANYHYDYESVAGYYGGIMLGAWPGEPGGYYGIFMVATEGHSHMQYIGSLL